MPKAFSFRGKNLEEIKSMSVDEFVKLLTARERRTFKRGFTEQQKKLLENVKKNPEKFHKTHVRDMLILKWATIIISPEMLGKRLGDFAISTKRVKHSAPGIGATRGSKFIATK